MLGARHHRGVAGEVVALKAPHPRGGEAAAEIGVLARSFDAAAPARIARDVDHRCEGPVDPRRRRLDRRDPRGPLGEIRSEEHTSELQSLMRTSYAVFCLNKNKYLN